MNTANRRGRTVAIVQARMKSTRLPGKVMADIGAGRMIDLVLDRAARAHRLDALWLATSKHPQDDALAEHVERKGVSVFRGEEYDVLSRYAVAARLADARVVVRITADCPLIDPEVIDLVVAAFHDTEADFVSNTLERSWPDGLDVEVFSREALERSEREAQHPFLREGVTPFMHGMRRNYYPCGDFMRKSLRQPQNFGHLRWTVDTQADLDFVRRVVDEISPSAGWLEIVALLTLHPELVRTNIAPSPAVLRHARPDVTLAAVVAHPDDEVLCCGGVLARHVRDGGRAAVLFLATGAGARGREPAPDEIAALRAAAEQAAKVLGVGELRFADFPDNRMDSVPLLDVVHTVERFLAESGAEMVLTHYLGDLNIDHALVSRAVLTATRPLPGAPVQAVFAGETLSATEWGFAERRFAPTTYADISKTLETKKQALCCYAKELRAFPHPRSIEAVEHLARLRGSESGFAAAEAYVPLRQLL